MRYLQQVLPNALIHARKNGMSIEGASGFLKAWRPESLLADGGVVTAAFLPALLSRCFDMGECRRPFVSWLDQVLLAAGYEPLEVDVAWGQILRSMLLIPSKEAERPVARLIIAQLLDDLPARCREALNGSAIGPQLRDLLGEPDDIIEVSRGVGDSVQIVARIAQRHLAEQSARSLAAYVKGQKELVDRGNLVFRPHLSPDANWVVEILVGAREDGEGEPIPGLGTWTTWYQQLTADDPALRVFAWDKVLEIAASLGVMDVADDHFRKALGNDSSGEDVGGEAQRRVRRIRRLFAGLLDQTILRGNWDLVKTLLAALEPGDVQAWLPQGMTVPVDAEDPPTIATEAVFQRVPQGLADLVLPSKERLTEIARAYGSSLFGDGADTMSRVAQAAFMADAGGDWAAAHAGKRRALANSIAEWLAHVREVLPLQRTWINCCLAAIIASREGDVWYEKTGPVTTTDTRSVALLDLIHNMLCSALRPANPRSTERVAAISAVQRQMEAYLGLTWLTQGVHPTTARYFAALGSAILATELPSLERTLSDGEDPEAGTHAGPLHDALSSAVPRLLFAAVATRPAVNEGRYRSEWSPVLPYEIAYLSKNIDPQALKALMSDELRGLMLGAGLSHMVNYPLLGLPAENGPLDGRLDDAPDGGVAHKLLSIGKPDRWLSRDQQILDWLENGIPEDWFARQWTGGDASIGDLLAQHVGLVLCGATAATPRWVTTVEALTDPATGGLLRSRPDFIRLVSKAAAACALARPQFAARLMNWLAAPPGSLPSEAYEHLVEAALYLLWANARSPQPESAIDSKLVPWLGDVLSSPEIEPPARRASLKLLGSGWLQFPATLRARLYESLERARRDPSVRTWPEWQYYGFALSVQGDPDGG